MHNEKIKNICMKVFANIKKEDIKILEQLKLGMSNYVYLIDVKNEKYTIRIPGNYAEIFVDRSTEKLGIEIISPYVLCPETICFNQNGIKISKYIEGRVLYKNILEDDYTNISVLLHSLHSIKNSDLKPYNPFIKLDYFEHLISLPISEKYEKIKNRLLEYKDFLLKQEMVVCHNDSQPSNFVFGIDNKMYLLDYEFIGLNDPLYDVACFGNNNIEDGEKLLISYLNKEPNKEENNRYYLWRTFQNIQWYLVALYKHELKMDEKLGLDFKMVSEMFLSQAEYSISKVK